MDSRKNTLNSTTMNEPESGDSQTNQQFRPQDSAVDKINKQLNLLLEAVHETAAENHVLNKELLKFLRLIDFEPHLLSREVTQAFDKIQAIMRKENLADIDETSLLIRLHQRKIDELKKAREERRIKRKYEDLCNEYSQLQEKLNLIQTKVNNLTTVILSAKEDDNEVSNLIHKSNKLYDYKRTHDALEEELSNLKLTEDCSQKIIGKYEHYMQASGELAQINESINQYGDLPPDILQARAVVEQLERRRQEVKRLLEEKIN